MKTSTANRMAEEIVKVLKYNPELSENDKILCVELRLASLIRDVETSCAEAHKRSQDNAVVIDSRPQDIPELASIMINSQQHRGPAN
jgi:hypothetical protein